MAHWRSAWRQLHRAPELLACLREARRPAAVAAQYLQLRRFAPGLFERRGGGLLELRDYEDLVTAWVIFVRREYRVPPGAATILDLGANIGAFTVLASQRCPAARLVSVEPFPPTFARLEATIARNGLAPRVSAWPVGVAARAGERVIPAAQAPSQSLGMLGGDTGVRREGDTAIRVETLDALVERACSIFGTGTIDFVKMDVEGAEHEAVRAASAASLRRIGALAMEYHPNDEKRGLFAALEQGGLRLRDDRPIGPAAGIAHFDR